MNPGNAVECLINLASTPYHNAKIQPQVSDQTLVSLIVSIRALLERIHAKSSLEEDITAFCTLTSLPNIRLLVQCRHHPPFAVLEGWPHLLFLELSNFCSRLATQCKSPPHVKNSVERELDRVHMHACAQVPVLWDSFMASFSRQETSPLTRVVILRLLYLALVVQPKLCGENPTRPKSLVNTLLSHLAAQIEYLLRDSPFSPNEEAIMLTLGVASALNLFAFRHERDSYWLTRSRHCTMSIELLEWMYCDRGTKDAIVHSLYEWTPVASWLISLHDFIQYLDSSEIVLNVLCDWLVYANDRDDGWSDLIIPALVEYPAKALDSLEGMLGFATKLEDLVNRHLISLIIKPFLFLASTIGVAEISRECWARRRHQRKTLLVLFFLYNDEVNVQQDIIEYLLILDELVGGDDKEPGIDSSAVESPNDITDAKWWERAANEAISRLRSHLDDIQLDSLQAMDSLISFLIYTLRHFTPCPEASQRLRAVLRQLVEHLYTDDSDTISFTLRQNTLVLCSSIAWPYESPLVAGLPAHLDHFVANQPSSEENTCREFYPSQNTYSTLSVLLTQHIRLLAEASLLAKCTDDQTSTACYVLFDELLLLIQGGMDFSSSEAQAHLSGICSALLCLIEAGSTTAGERLRRMFSYVPKKYPLVDFLGSSPWLFTVRLELGRVLQSTEELTQLGESRELVCSLFVNLESCAGGTTLRPSKTTDKRRVEMKRSEAGILVIFVE